MGLDSCHVGARKKQKSLRIIVDNRGENDGKRAHGYHARCKVEYRPIG